MARVRIGNAHPLRLPLICTLLQPCLNVVLLSHGR